MSKKILFLVLAAAVCSLAVSASSFAADAKKPAVPTAAQGARPQAPRPAFNMLAGTIVKIDTTDPANVKMEVKNDADGAVRIVSVTPMTNITKVTDISELKAGDAVRVMSKKSEGAEVAMGVMFGKLAARPMPRPAARAAAPKAPAKK